MDNITQKQLDEIFRDNDKIITDGLEIFDSMMKKLIVDVFTGGNEEHQKRLKIILDNFLVDINNRMDRMRFS